MINVTLCGGSGTRLWPVSRMQLPKQFCVFRPPYSLLQETLLRNRATCDRLMVVSNIEHQFMLNDQIAELGADGFDASFSVYEPFGKNTAPAIAFAALLAEPEDILLVTPSDHVIANTDAYNRCVRQAEQFAREGYIVTFGITPDRPETGYGYIHADGNVVKGFKEKPDRDTAESYLASGEYLWNSGMFCFRADVFLGELKTYAPDLFDAAVATFNASTRNEVALTLNPDAMAKMRSESIDYAVMERSDIVRVVPADIGWNDVGSFDALADILPQNEAGTATTGNAIEIGGKGNLILAGKRLVAAIDLEDMIVVDTPDALLVAPKSSAQKVKEVVKRLQEGTQEEVELTTLHQTVHRPWGTYTVLEQGVGHKIKRIVVKPGKRLSLQMHYHRSEHWNVVSGTAVVTVGTSETIVRANESAYIPKGQAHRLENPGKIDLVIIEVQVGEYLGEDDIVRLTDDYGRSSQ